MNDRNLMDLLEALAEDLDKAGNQTASALVSLASARLAIKDRTIEYYQDASAEQAEAQD